MQDFKEKLSELLNNYKEDFTCTYSYNSKEEDTRFYKIEKEDSTSFFNFVEDYTSSTKELVIELEDFSFSVIFITSWTTYSGSDPTDFTVYKFKKDNEECYVLTDKYRDSWGGGGDYDSNWNFAEPVYVKQQAFLVKPHLYIESNPPSLDQIID